jgi:K+-transporting ATPase ATPase C chain
MNAFVLHLRATIVSTFVLMGILCGLYPLVVWVIAQILFPHQANGSLIVQDGRVVGSALIGQPFGGPAYLHPRPSAAGSGYDAANSSGTNLGPLSRKLIETVAQRVAAYRQDNGLAEDMPVPADAVTASASGLDPHLSPEAALLQADRVAQARGIATEQVRTLIETAVEGRGLGILGDPRVNVLLVNLALDRRFGRMSTDTTSVQAR